MANKTDAESASPAFFTRQPCPKIFYLQRLSYFEAARSLANRSILDVCEDLANKADAKRANLYR